MKHRFAVLIACFLLTTRIAGQEAPQPIVIGETASIESRVLDETRRVYVATPPSYDESEDRYGVVYVLDGDSQFRHAVAAAEFLGGFANQSIPPLVVVGIGNTDRMRDMTPRSEAPENRLLAQGGADRFLAFLLDELRPWVDEHYRTTDYSVLVGHSLGGLFAVHSLISRPDAFDGLLIIDPSLNWNSQAIVQQASDFLGGDPDLNASLYLAVSSVEASDNAGTRSLVDRLENDAPSGLRWDLEPFVGESHDSVPFPAAFQGLRWIFSDWDVVDRAEATFSDAPADEIFEDIDEIYRQSGERFGLARDTPYLVFESLLGYLAENDRIDEAASLTLDHTDRYPLPLVPNVIAGIAQLFVANGDRDSAVEYLNAVLEIYPGNETAGEALADIEAAR